MTQNIKLIRQDIFPTRIWSFDLLFLQPLFAQWLDVIHKWRAAEPEPARRSNRLGWNSDKRVLQLAPFAPLQQAAQKCFHHAFEEMKLPDPKRFQLEAWVNLHDRGGFNTLHVHPNVLLCGSFYLQVPDGAGSLVFRDPRPGVVLTSSMKNAHAIQPTAGQLLLFPHWLDHRVEPNEANEPRISIAINALSGSIVPLP